MADFALVDPGKSLKTPQSSSVRGILLQSPKIYNKKDIVLITPEKKIDDNEIFTDTRKTCFATNAISAFSFFKF